MKKVLYGVFMAFFAVMTMGAIQSCTDDLTDFKGQYNYDYTALKAQVNSIETELGSLDSYVKGEILNRITALESDNATNKADIAQLKGLCATLGVDVADLKTGLTKAQEDIAAMKGVVDACDAYIQQLKDADIINKVNGLVTTVNDLKPKVTELYDEVFKEGGLKDQVSDLEERVAALEDDFAKLQKQVNVLTNRVNELITDILIQATDSPVFGNFSLPIGIQSNMLFGWCFTNENKEAFTFPSNDKSYAYNGVSPEYPQFKNASGAVSIADGEMYANLGKLYVTINPIGHDVLTGKTFSLETSKGETGRLPYTLEFDEDTDEEIYFGYHNTTATRNTENGFYAANVVWKENKEDHNKAAIEAADVKINDDLKSAVKAILEDRTKRTALNLVKAVWDQVNGTFPRYAVRADWTVVDSVSGDDLNYSALSKYDLGVATAQPLSFAFLKDGQGIHSRPIPSFNHHFANIVAKLKEHGPLYIDFRGKINVPEIEGITIKPVEEVNITKLQITISGGTGVSAEITEKDWNDFKDQIKGLINESLANAGTSITEEVNGEIEKMVTSVTDQLNQKVNGKIDAILNKVQEKGEPWFQRLDKLVDLYNRAADKINNFLDKPNAYLQPCVFYKADGTMGLVSNDTNYPTMFVNGGGTAFDLFPTTYTAELVAPAYKKYIKCINDDAVNASCTQYLDKVLDGSVYKIVIPTSAMNSDKTYEFIYQALDYYGKTSTCKFYIKVK